MVWGCITVSGPGQLEIVDKGPEFCLMSANSS